MVKLENEFRKDGLVLLGITNESPDLVRDFFKRQGYSFTTVLDPKDDVSDVYSFNVTPTIVLIGRHGQVLGRVIGARDWASANGRAFIRHLLALP